jgi:SAM-dependent methyltransferase
MNQFRDYDLWVSQEETMNNQMKNKKALENMIKTCQLIDDIGGIRGDVLDIGDRNYFTYILEEKYNVKIDSTQGDLDEEFTCPKEKYDFIHYNNVIEHQFNPLFTLLEIKKHLKPLGLVIFGTPLKPKFITDATCHFNEFNLYQYEKIIARAGLKEVKRMHYYYQVNIKGIRLLIGSFYKRQVLSILKINL